jgi:hypothetical protein
LFFAIFRGNLQVWKPGPYNAVCLEESLSLSQIPAYFAEHQTEFTPSRIYDAKTRGRLPGSNRQLRFVDVGLLPFAENEIGSKLTETVVTIIDLLLDSFQSKRYSKKREDWILKSTFRLIAAKILKDKNVANFSSLDITNLSDVFRRVQHHYGSLDRITLGQPEQQGALEQAASIIWV